MSGITRLTATIGLLLIVVSGQVVSGQAAEPGDDFDHLAAINKASRIVNHKVADVVKVYDCERTRIYTARTPNCF